MRPDRRPGRPDTGRDREHRLWPSGPCNPREGGGPPAHQPRQPPRAPPGNHRCPRPATHRPHRRLGLEASIGLPRSACDADRPAPQARSAATTHRRRGTRAVAAGQNWVSPRPAARRSGQRPGTDGCPDGPAGLTTCPARAALPRAIAWQPLWGIGGWVAVLDDQDTARASDPRARPVGRALIMVDRRPARGHPRARASGVVSIANISGSPALAGASRPASRCRSRSLLIRPWARAS